VVLVFIPIHAIFPSSAWKEERRTSIKGLLHHVGILGAG